jgi:D-alanyl-D-alanine carboxypeptidase
MCNCRALAAAALLIQSGFAIPAQTLSNQLDSILAALPDNSWSAQVQNETGSFTLYERNPDNGLAPASNTKMFTTAAAFGLLGTNYTFETRIYYDGTLTNGHISGNLNLVCEHDPTWNTSVFRSARAPLDHIAAQLKAMGVSSVASNVQCYGACAYNLSSTGFLNAGSTESRNAAAAAAFRVALRGTGIVVSGDALGQAGFSAPGTLLYTHRSSDLNYRDRPLKLDVACIPLLKVSHNVMADLLCRHIGWKLSGSDSYSAGASQVLAWLERVAGIRTNTIVLNDGSGLSRGNRVSARQCVDLTRYMLSAFPSWHEGLPIGCVDGTIRSRFCGTDGEKEVHAKTGSLRISIALSGYLHNQYDGQRYLFSFLSNRTNIDQTATRNVIDNAVARVCGPFRMLQPEVTWAKDQVAFRWPTTPGCVYRIEFKDRLSEPEWHVLGTEITATANSVARAAPMPSAMEQRFYRVLWVN